MGRWTRSELPGDLKTLQVVLQHNPVFVQHLLIGVNELFKEGSEPTIGEAVAAYERDLAAREGGKIVTGRKGVGRFEIYITGVPAHAGTRPQDGRSAIRELGNIITTLEAMNDPARGVTVNVGVVRGGTRPNVIAEEAYAEVDMRLPNFADGFPSVNTMSAVKSFEPRISDEPTP